MNLQRILVFFLLGTAAFLVTVLAIYIALRAKTGHSGHGDIATVTISVATLAFSAGISCATCAVFADLRNKGRITNLLANMAFLFLLPWVLAVLVFMAAQRMEWVRYMESLRIAATAGS